MSDNKSPSQFPIPGLALAVLALGVLVFSDNPFKPTRPEAPTEITSTAEDVLARLWQDPFEAVEQHRKNKHTNKENKDNPPLVIQNRSDIAEFTTYQDQQHRICSYSDKNNSYLGLDTSAHTIEELRCQILRDVEVDVNMKTDLHILAVMVSGGPYAENRETRIRSRYAVVSGLSNAGYIPKDAEHIGYIDFSGICKRAIKENNEGLIKFCDWPATIPYEWFEPKETQIDDNKENNFSKKILVLWLDDEEIGQVKPLSMLDRLWFGLIPGSLERYAMKKDLVRIKFDVLGPAGSTTLVKMYREAENATCNSDYNLSKCLNKNFRLISPRATIEDEAIENILSTPDKKYKINEWPEIYRTIPTDKKLVENLLCELMQRGINPYSLQSDFIKYKENNSGQDKKTVKDKVWEMSQCQNYSVSQLNKNTKQDHIVLIGEWDTVYSRNFNVLFRELISEQSNNDNIGWLHSFNYLRGIDGSLGQSDQKQEKTSNKDKSKKSFRRPVGANQFDYLRRLGEQLSELSSKLVNENRGTIRAIGIVGSDTYDKLLILQALRSRFPNVIFFTTDLDARMLHNEENKWARNLIVASGFGLTPEIELFQGLPFRDSYQTSLFLASLYATQTNESNLRECLTAKIFEIGNNKAVDYSHSTRPEKHNFSDKIYLYLTLSFLLLLLLVYQTSTYTRKYIIIIALVIYTVIAWLYFIGPDKSNEFNAISTGTSIWPAVIVRMFAAVLAVFFIFIALANLKKNSIKIIKVHNITDNNYNGIVDNLRNCFDEQSKTHKTIWVSLIACVNKIIETIRSFYGIRFFTKEVIEQRNLKQPTLLSHIFLSVWGWRFRFNEEIKLDELFFQYMHIAKTRWWLLRVGLMTALYFCLSFIFMFSFPNLPLTPFSDEISANANYVVMRAGLIPYIFLIFLVVDVTRLNARFVELLTKCHVIWSEKVLLKCRNEFGVSKEVALEKLKLDLIVQRAKAVDVLIFLPFFVLSLMIISRSTFFDRWHMTLPLAIIIMLGALIALSSAIRFRRTAKKARKRALNNLTKMYHTQCHDENKPVDAGNNDETDYCSKNMSERIMLIIEDIKSINTGPFVPITRHPIITAIAMPFGGIGGLYLIDYMAGAGI